jgi:alcohol dehydrogenase class IV
VTTPAPVRHFAYEALPGRVVFGAGAARTRLAGEVERLGARRLLVVAGSSAEAVARELAAPLGERVVEVFTGVREHVPLEVAERARAVAAAVGADALLSVGGGSTTGTAKAVALTTGLPVLAVPTTYAGSEVTPVWGITDRERKRTGVDAAVLPRVVVYDPELTLGLPSALSVASGFNAMAHCVEAFWAPQRNPVTSLLAEEGIRALAAGLPAVAADGSDLAARTELLYGAYLAGCSFAAAGSGLHHKICHVLGGAYGLPHAQTHAIVLPHVLAFNAPAAPQAERRIAAALGGAAPALRLAGLADRLGVPAGLARLGLAEDRLEEAAQLVAEVVPADNPRPAAAADLYVLLRAAWAGDRTVLQPDGAAQTSPVAADSGR